MHFTTEMRDGTSACTGAPGSHYWTMRDLTPPTKEGKQARPQGTDHLGAQSYFL